MNTINWTVTEPRRLPLCPLLWYSHVLRGSVIMHPRLLGLTRRQAYRRANQWISHYVTPAYRGEL